MKPASMSENEEGVTWQCRACCEAIPLEAGPPSTSLPLHIPNCLHLRKAVSWLQARCEAVNAERLRAAASDWFQVQRPYISHSFLLDSRGVGFLGILALERNEAEQTKNKAGWQQQPGGANTDGKKRNTFLEDMEAAEGGIGMLPAICNLFQPGVSEALQCVAALSHEAVQALQHLQGAHIVMFLQNNIQAALSVLQEPLSKVLRQPSIVLEALRMLETQHTVQYVLLDTEILLLLQSVLAESQPLLGALDMQVEEVKASLSEGAKQLPSNSLLCIERSLINLKVQLQKEKAAPALIMLQIPHVADVLQHIAYWLNNHVFKEDCDIPAVFHQGLLDLMKKPGIYQMLDVLRQSHKLLPMLNMLKDIHSNSSKETRKLLKEVLLSANLLAILDILESHRGSAKSSGVASSSSSLSTKSQSKSKPPSNVHLRPVSRAQASTPATSATNSVPTSQAQPRVSATAQSPAQAQPKRPSASGRHLLQAEPKLPPQSSQIAPGPFSQPRSSQSGAPASARSFQSGATALPSTRTSQSGAAASASTSALPVPGPHSEAPPQSKALPPPRTPFHANSPALAHRSHQPKAPPVFQLPPNPSPFLSNPFTSDNNPIMSAFPPSAFPFPPVKPSQIQAKDHRPQGTAGAQQEQSESTSGGQSQKTSKPLAPHRESNTRGGGVEAFLQPQGTASTQRPAGGGTASTQGPAGGSTASTQRPAGCGTASTQGPAGGSTASTQGPAGGGDSSRPATSQANRRRNGAGHGPSNGHQPGPGPDGKEGRSQPPRQGVGDVPGSAQGRWQEREGDERSAETSGQDHAPPGGQVQGPPRGQAQGAPGGPVRGRVGSNGGRREPQTQPIPQRQGQGPPELEPRAETEPLPGAGTSQGQSIDPSAFETLQQMIARGGIDVDELIQLQNQIQQMIQLQGQGSST